MKKRIQRVFKLLIRFWIIMILTCCVGYIMGMREQFPGSWLNFVLNTFRDYEEKSVNMIFYDKNER